MVKGCQQHSEHVKQTFYWTLDKKGPKYFQNCEFQNNKIIENLRIQDFLKTQIQTKTLLLVFPFAPLDCSSLAHYFSTFPYSVSRPVCTLKSGGVFV